jgi:hypothetical protein
MALTESMKLILTNAIRDWMKFAVERERLILAANEVAVITRKVVHDCILFLKTNNIDVQCENVDEMKILGITVHIDPVIDATFPNVKATVVLKCSGSTRAILINPNMTISAGGNVVTFDELKRAIPAAFASNAADFVKDSFLYVARTGAKEE